MENQKNNKINEFLEMSWFQIINSVISTKDSRHQLNKIVRWMGEEAAGLFHVKNMKEIKHEPEKNSFKNTQKIIRSIKWRGFIDKEKQEIFNGALIFGHYPTANYLLKIEEKIIFKEQNINRIFSKIISSNENYFTYNIFANDNDWLSLVNKNKEVTSQKSDFYKKFILKLKEYGFKERIFNDLLNNSLRRDNELLFREIIGEMTMEELMENDILGKIMKNNGSDKVKNKFNMLFKELEREIISKQIEKNSIIKETNNKTNKI